MKARYQNGNTARFLSIDPLFISFGFSELFTNPQRMNSYGYALNNPVICHDPTGESASFAYFMNFMVPRVDNLSGGYVSRQARVYAEQAPKAALAAGATVAGAYVVAEVGPVFATSQLTRQMILGAGVNTAMRGYVDYTDNGRIDDTAVQYGGSAFFGAAGGYYLPNLSWKSTLVGAGTLSATENMLLDGSLQPRQVASNVIGAGAGKYVGSAFSTPAYSNSSSILSDIAQSLTELSAAIASYSISLNKSEKTEDNDR